MLTPDQLQDAGEQVAVVYRQIEAELCEYLVDRMIEGDVAGQRTATAINLLAQSMPAELNRIIDARSDEIDDAVAKEVKALIAASDAFDMAVIGASAVSAAEAAAAQAAVAIEGAMRAIRADNLAMAEAARAKFVQWSVWAMTQTATGNMTEARAVRMAVREIAREGTSIPFVTYRDKDGNITVRNRADVAVQRHVRSAITQGAAALTMRRMQENGIEYAEVSSHAGSRPSHAEWQGNVYHIGGAVTVDGVRYEDFEFGTGYGGKAGPYASLGDRLLGINCRHSFAPWVPGSPRAFSPDPESPTGLDNDEIYRLTQGQRRRERDIRGAKRELAAAQRLYDAEPTPENLADVGRAKALLRNRQQGMREYIKAANERCNPGTTVLKRQPSREWAGDMPKIATKNHIDNEYSSARAAATPQWKNREVGQISTPTEASDYLESKYGIEAMASFSDLPIAVQREVIAGIDDAASLYGIPAVETLWAMESKVNDGVFNAGSAAMRISESASSHYLAAFHETIHAIDAEKSSHMGGFSKKPLALAYNMHSDKVLREARRVLGLKANDRAYKDLVLEVMGMNLGTFNKDSSKPFEVVAYALDFEAQGRTNILSRTIKEMF